MLVNWSYVDFGVWYYGEYQSDVLDLKSFMRQKGLVSVYLLHCKLQDRCEYIWRNPRSFKGELRSGWIRIA